MQEMTKPDEGGVGGSAKRWPLLTEGGGGVYELLFLADVICEQPLSEYKSFPWLTLERWQQKWQNCKLSTPLVTKFTAGNRTGWGQMQKNQEEIEDSSPGWGKQQHKMRSKEKVRPHIIFDNFVLARWTLYTFCLYPVVSGSTADYLLL